MIGRHRRGGRDTGPGETVEAFASMVPRAIIVTHLYGRLARIDEILQLPEPWRGRGRRCAHGARSNSRAAGSFGDVAAFSFYPTKNLGALGDGGAIVTSDTGIGQRARPHPCSTAGPPNTNTHAGGRNSRLDEIQARMLLTMLPLLDGWNARRREIANRYSNEIRNPAIAVRAPAGEEYVSDTSTLSIAIAAMHCARIWRASACRPMSTIPCPTIANLPPGCLRPHPAAGHRKTRNDGTHVCRASPS